MTLSRQFCYNSFIRNKQGYNFNTQTGRFTPNFSAVEQQIMAAMLAQYGAEALLKLMGLPYTKVQDSSVPQDKMEMTVELLKTWEQRNAN